MGLDSANKVHSAVSTRQSATAASAARTRDRSAVAVSARTVSTETTFLASSKADGPGGPADAAARATSARSASRRASDARRRAAGGSPRWKPIALEVSGVAAGALSESEELDGLDTAYGAARTASQLVGFARDASGAGEASKPEASRASRPADSGRGFSRESASRSPSCGCHSARRTRRPEASTAPAASRVRRASATSATRMRVAGRASAAASSTAASAATVGSAAAAPLVLLLVFAVMLFLALSTCSATYADSSAMELSEEERAVYSYFSGLGWDDVHIAALMGNIRRENGTFDAGLVSESSGATGLCQWLGDRLGRLASFASSRDGSMYDMQVQLDFVVWEMENTHTSFSSSFLSSADVDSTTDAVTDLYEAPYPSYASESEKEAEREIRRAYAREYYDAFTGASDPSSAQGTGTLAQAQADLVEFAYFMASHPSGSGLCMKWVRLVFQGSAESGASASEASTYGWVSSGWAARYASAWTSMPNAVSCWEQWCTSANFNELKVGMVVASGYSPDGHIGIYVGDGKVIHNTTGNGAGYVVVTDLEDWIASFEKDSEVRWGWLLGIALDGSSDGE